MARYAQGKHSFLIDDVSGFKIRYKDARTQWNKLRVHKREFEERHPQEDPRPRLQTVDPQRLKDTRPDNDDMGTVTEQLSTSLSNAGRAAHFGAT